MTKMEFNTAIIKEEQTLNNFALQLTSNKSAANDLVQDTYVKALTNQERFMSYEKQNLKGWLLTIMKNLFINNYRKNQRRKTLSEQSMEILPQKQMNNSPEDEYNIKEIGVKLNSLNDNQRVPLKLFLEGYQYQEIADKLNINLGTVKSRIFFTRKKLKEQLNYQM